MKKLVSIISIMLAILTLSALAGCEYPGNVGNSPGASPYYDNNTDNVINRDNDNVNRNTTNRVDNAVDNVINNGVDNKVNNGGTGNTGTRNAGTAAGANAR